MDKEILVKVSIFYGIIENQLILKGLWVQNLGWIKGGNNHSHDFKFSGFIKIDNEQISNLIRQRRMFPFPHSQIKNSLSYNKKFLELLNNSIERNEE